MVRAMKATVCSPAARRLVAAFGVLALVISAPAARAGETRIAVAANFTDAAREIGALFDATSGHRAVFSFGSTGQLYAQIGQGAPFDAFVAADRDRPQKAVDDGLAVPGSRFTYATGRLALYSRQPGLVAGPQVLTDANVTRLAIANPATAPYGAAAVDVMQALGVFDVLGPKLVRGNNVAQTFQFVATGNAELGFVALSQIAGRTGGSRWIVPEDLHAPIAQDAVLLTHGAGNDAARAFLAFLRGPAARAVKEKYGYGAGE
jgi:molybdate transport system substrate-binding protein